MKIGVTRIGVRRYQVSIRYRNKAGLALRFRRTVNASLSDARLIAVRLAQEFALEDPNAQLQEAIRRERMSDKRPIYLVRNPATGLLKIGVATDIKARIMDLETGAGVRLQLIATIKSGGVRRERQIHKELKDLRIRGEWFRDDPRVRRYFQENTMPL